MSLVTNDESPAVKTRPPSDIYADASPTRLMVRRRKERARPWYRREALAALVEQDLIHGRVEIGLLDAE